MDLYVCVSHESSEWPKTQAKIVQEAKYSLLLQKLSRMIIAAGAMIVGSNPPSTIERPLFKLDGAIQDFSPEREDHRSEIEKGLTSFTENSVFDYQTSLEFCWAS
ncbi:hypothetical protein Nepgr_019723 [Nepenthes gracilis]|uniref:Uncharacterized protein n=1 Tax=Nepenthes gracilis TaxID=150966 RepID=A0AAD3SWK6_NEPGR|nr:hypothetical protein Nepgr_019723 [Nepenthes gracilis]